MEMAESFNDIFPSVLAVKVYFLNSAHTSLVLEAGVQETKKAGTT